MVEQHMKNRAIVYMCNEAHVQLVPTKKAQQNFDLISGNIHLFCKRKSIRNL